MYESPSGSGVWHINYYDSDGRRHREKVGPKSAAIDAYRLRKTQIRVGQFFPPNREAKLMFEDLMDLAFAERRARVTPLSYTNDKCRKAVLLSDWRGLTAAAVTPQRISEKLRQMRDAGLSGSTVNRYRSLISSIFAFAMRTQRMLHNPAAQVPRYKENEHRIRFLDEEEEKSLRAAIRDRQTLREPEPDLALNTGIRRGEQFSLKWEDGDLDRGILTVAENGTPLR